MLSVQSNRDGAHVVANLDHLTFAAAKRMIEQRLKTLGYRNLQVEFDFSAEYAELVLFAGSIDINEVADRLMLNPSPSLNRVRAAAKRGLSVFVTNDGNNNSVYSLAPKGVSFTDKEDESIDEFVNLVYADLADIANDFCSQFRGTGCAFRL